MAAPPIKFRCYQCHQLLGVSRTKIGASVPCPRCGTELIVPPSPVNAPGFSAIYSNSTATPGGTDSVIGLDFLDIRPEDLRAEPGAIAESAEAPEVVEEPIAAVAMEAAPPAPVAPTVIEMAPAIPPTEAAAVVAPRPIAPVLVERPPTYRARDVVLPRSTVALWMLFVLMAQTFAFLAGLFAGHYLWRVH